MPSFNSVIIMGNLTRDPEPRTLPSGTVKCDICVAVNESVKKGGEWVEAPSFVSVVLWNRSAELAQEYARKGDLVLIEGRLKQERWETQDGNRSALKVYGEKIKFFAKTTQDAPQNASTSGTANNPTTRPTATQNESRVPSYGGWPPPPRSPKVWEVNQNDDPAELEGLRDVSEADLDLPF